MARHGYRLKSFHTGLIGVEKAMNLKGAYARITDSSREKLRLEKLGLIEVW